jgi:hypothetical protein
MFAVSFSQWCSRVLSEGSAYFNRMNETQWGVVAACVVAIGFMCLKGNLTNRAL